METSTEIVAQEQIISKIYYIRGHKVMLDSDLAELYQVSTRVFNQAIRRNIERFPEDFMFQLTKNEFENLRSQIVTSSWGGRRYMPYAFTEQGVAMLSSILSSNLAVQINISIMRTFVKIREMMTTNEFIRQRLEELEKRSWVHDDKIENLFKLMDLLLDQPLDMVKNVGFLKENNLE